MRSPALDEARRVRVRCPDCGKDTALWRGVEVPGWQGLGPDLKPAASTREVEWDHARFDGTFGCGECEWEGRDLERVSEIDGEPLPIVHARQEALAV